MDGKPRTRPSEDEIAALVRRQHGVVSRAQLIALGLGEDAIDSRLASGRLHRLHRGVYASGHGIIPREGLWLAAVMTVGEGAVLSHRSAAELWGVRRKRGEDRPHVSVARRSNSPPGIRRHCMGFRTDEVTARRRIPVTTLARTLLDIASEAPAEGLEGAIREAEFRHRFQLERLAALLERHPGRRGATTIKTCLRRLGLGRQGRTREELEVRFAALLARTGLPKPELNALLDLDGSKIEADCLWRDQRLIVELDGGQAHRTRVAFESDRERDRRLQVAGWKVIRITWRQLDNPSAVLTDLHLLLSSSSSRFPAI